jgi:hypothetical protein
LVGIGIDKNDFLPATRPFDAKVDRERRFPGATFHTTHQKPHSLLLLPQLIRTIVPVPYYAPLI